MKVLNALGFAIALVTAAAGCDVDERAIEDSPAKISNEDTNTQEYDDLRQETTSGATTGTLCSGNLISTEAVKDMLLLTEVTEHEDIYSTYNRIDAISDLFEACEDPWGLFPLTYRHITARGIKAIENGEFEDPDWARRIIVDFAGRYLANLRLALQGERPSWAWEHYYMLADRDDVSRTRSVLVAMVAHLTLDLPHSLVAINTTEDNKEDFFVFGEMMIEVADDFIADLRVVYDTDAEDILNGFLSLMSFTN